MTKETLNNYVNNKENMSFKRKLEIELETELNRPVKVKILTNLVCIYPVDYEKYSTCEIMSLIKEHNIFGKNAVEMMFEEEHQGYVGIWVNDIEVRQ